VTPTLRTAAVDLLSTHIPERWVRQRAWGLGVIRRVGKIDPYALVMVVLLGLVVRGPTSIAQLRQVYCGVAGTIIVGPDLARRLLAASWGIAA